jgi:hypothetical protein
MFALLTICSILAAYPFLITVLVIEAVGAAFMLAAYLIATADIKSIR